ncbi:MAG: hypothetical protein K8I30_18830, partial [Anaerolineae bacterium]|nr:hypothetical protein [Anaerolineae bacterium]
ALLIMAGTILNRFDVTWFGMKPVEGASYSPHWMEIAILVGVLAGVVLVYSLIARYFPVYEETVAYKAPTAEPKPLEAGEVVKQH